MRVEVAYGAYAPARSKSELQSPDLKPSVALPSMSQSLLFQRVPSAMAAWPISFA